MCYYFINSNVNCVIYYLTLKMIEINIFISFFLFLKFILFGKNFSINKLLKSIILFYFISLFLLIILISNSIINNLNFTSILFLFLELNIFQLWFKINSSNLIIIMFKIIIFISTLVQIFSINYMKIDPHINRFIAYLNLFTLFMLILVSSSNLIQLFLGWEGVGLTSYLLISFWYQRIEAIKSSFKALLVNKIGDISFLLLIMIIFLNFYTLDIFTLKAILYSSPCILIGIAIIIATIGKSAQIGLHSWLPDAMEGPTPVSALIHAATMVTAGVFLIINLSFFLEKLVNLLLFILIIGSLTTFFSSTIGLYQTDYKKIIAYSTCSQLGYMVLISGLSYYSLSLFHLFNHAFFKALLFLSAGSIIHTLLDDQDLRKSGNLIKSNPISYVSFLIGSLSLMGLPFLTGFYSKDFIIELSFINQIYFSVLILSLISAIITTLYSYKLILNSFIFSSKQNYLLVKLQYENNYLISIPLLILFFFSIFIGKLTSYLFLKENIAIIIFNYKIIPFILIIIFFFCYFLYLLLFNNLLYHINWKSFFLDAWFINELINFFILKFTYPIGKFLYIKLDKQFIEYLGFIEIKNSIYYSIKIIESSYQGYLPNYIIFFISILFINTIKWLNI